MFSLLLMLACGGGEPAASETTAAPEAEVAQAVAPTPEPSKMPAPEVAPSEDDSLPTLSVVGGISSEDIAASLKSKHEAIASCESMARTRTPPLFGSVLLKFSVDAEGKVQRSKTHRSTLSDEEVEQCFNDVVLETTFPKLTSGRVAIVHFPFVVSKT